MRLNGSSVGITFILVVKHTCSLSLNVEISLVPRPLLFCLSVCIQYNTQKQKSSEKRGRPGLIHHTSGRKVDVRGRGRCSNMYELSSPVKMSSFNYANIWSPELQ